jgi:hypothetical protein
LDKALV